MKYFIWIVMKREIASICIIRTCGISLRSLVVENIIDCLKLVPPSMTSNFSLIEFGMLWK